MGEKYIIRGDIVLNTKTGWMMCQTCGAKFSRTEKNKKRALLAADWFCYKCRVELK